MTGARKFTSPDGSTAIVFDTPCGFTITLVADTDDDVVRIDSHYSGVPISFANSNYRLSRDGAALLSAQIKDLLDARPE